MTESAHQSAMQARIEHDSLDSVAPFDFDPERGEQWPMPVTCAYCTSDNPAVLSTYCNLLCPSCIQRHFKKPEPAKPSFWAKVNAWLGGAS